MYTSTALQQYYSSKETIIIYYLNFLFFYFFNPNNLRLRIWIVPVFSVGFSQKKTWASFAHCRSPMWNVSGEDKWIKKEWKFKKSMKVTEVNNF